MFGQHNLCHFKCLPCKNISKTYWWDIERWMGHTRAEVFHVSIIAMWTIILTINLTIVARVLVHIGRRSWHKIGHRTDIGKAEMIKTTLYQSFQEVITLSYAATLYRIISTCAKEHSNTLCEKFDMKKL